ncbi:MAG: Y-family DNA polymerase [Deltaproteobacteria bacterium]|nr:Y-family DNA polymerase [Deltaproteobacteria bacterium]
MTSGTNILARLSGRPPGEPRARPAMWALVDCACFYCSCERLFRPDLADKPVVVLSNNDGCVVAITPEAKALGFKRGEVFFQSRDRLLAAGVAVFSSNYALYGDISRRVALAMESVTPAISQYSIDEAFVPFSRTLACQADEVGRALLGRVRRWVGVPVRVGMGPTRTLAKLANHWAKKLGPVLRLEQGSPLLEELLFQTPLEDVWGVGRRLSVKLASLGLKSAGDLRNFNAVRAGRLFSVTLERTVNELNGRQCVDNDLEPSPRKSLVSSRSFASGIKSKVELAQALAHHCAAAGEKLRAGDMAASVLSIHIATSRHADSPFQAGAAVELGAPTSSTPALIRASQLALERCFKPGPSYRQAGVMLLELRPNKSHLPNLLAPPPEVVKSDDLMRALDLINDRHGRGTVKFLAQGGAKPTWAMRQERLSDLSTTDWDKLPNVKA